jgi:hypothetical protein
MPAAVKPGLFTSELWLIVAAALEAATRVLSSSSHVNYAVLGSAVAYAACRTILKLTAPAPAAPPVVKVDGGA